MCYNVNGGIIMDIINIITIVISLVTCFFGYKLNKITNDEIGVDSNPEYLLSQDSIIRISVYCNNEKYFFVSFFYESA